MARWAKANQRAQWFQSKYPGDKMTPNVACLHTTESGTWPSYAGGASAPHFTGRPNFKKKRIDWRQHFDTTRSARALRNESGGVETNTLNVVQYELVGTCDKTSAKRYGWLYVPDAPDWWLREVAEALDWLHKKHPAFDLVDGAEDWLEYPSSYGATRVRMTFAEWNKSRGIVGHQHVPENTHGDPGDIAIGRLVKFAAGGAPDGGGQPDQKRTRVQRARGFLKDALRDADGHGYKKRAKKIRAALDDLPKR